MAVKNFTVSQCRKAEFYAPNVWRAVKNNIEMKLNEFIRGRLLDRLPFFLPYLHPLCPPTTQCQSLYCQAALNENIGAVLLEAALHLTLFILQVLFRNNINGHGRRGGQEGREREPGTRPQIGASVTNCGLSVMEWRHTAWGGRMRSWWTADKIYCLSNIKIHRRLPI